MIDNKPFLFSSADYLPFRNTLKGFYVTDIEECLMLSEYNLYYYYGVWEPNIKEIKCLRCGTYGHKHNGHDTVIKHMPIASTFTSEIFVLTNMNVQLAERPLLHNLLLNILIIEFRYSFTIILSNNLL